MILEEKFQVVLSVSLAQFNVSCLDRHALLDIFLLYQLHIKAILWHEQWWHHKWYKSVVYSWPVMAGLGVNVLIKTPEIHFCGPFNPFKLSIDRSIKVMLKGAISEKTRIITSFPPSSNIYPWVHVVQGFKLASLKWKLYSLQVKLNMLIYNFRQEFITHFRKYPSFPRCSRANYEPGSAQATAWLILLLFE